MLVIGHRGAAGVAPENTIESLRAGVEAGADMLEFDIHLSSDNIPVLIHDNNLIRTHRKRAFVNRQTFKSLQELTASSPNPIISLEAVLDEFFGEILLNIEIKQRRTAGPILELLLSKYIKKRSDWDLFVFSSFLTNELSFIRKHSERANLWLLHNRNPFIFIAFARRLNLDGVGFHRLHINDFAITIAKKTDLFTYAYTTNRIKAVKQLAARGIDGVVTDYPAKILAHIEKNAL
ncbi:MAG: glycerophosphodiester phosphodiesterase [Candidatus Saccharimonadales bacterium]